ncbi:MAG: glycosyltransferase family 4 protein [Deltaproteobacteria bacterium]|nr:glycosyltransferase family 4 protein [Deltaproteobacteria bacterium]
MNIAMVGQKGIPAISGGIEKHVEEIAVRLSATGHEVIVFTRSHYIRNTQNKYKGVVLKQVPHLKSKHLDAISHAFFATLYVIFHRKINLAHYHAIGPSLMLPLLRLFRPRLRVIATHHSRDYLHGKWNVPAMAILRFGEWSMCRFAHEVIAVSRTNQHYLEKKYRRRIHFIPNGTSIPRQESRPLPLDPPLAKGGFFLVVARLIPVKCIDDIIAAYQQLETDKSLVIAGESSHTDDYAIKVRSMAASNNKILFIGHQTPEQLAKLYSNAYLYINASSVEGLSIAVLEAMSYGCATLVSDIDGNLEAVGEQGLTFRQGDIGALRQKLDELLFEPSSVEANRNYSVERVRQHFNWDDIIKTIDNLYKGTKS